MVDTWTHGMRYISLKHKGIGHKISSSYFNFYEQIMSYIFSSACFIFNTDIYIEGIPKIKGTNRFRMPMKDTNAPAKLEKTILNAIFHEVHRNTYKLC